MQYTSVYQRFPLGPVSLRLTSIQDLVAGLGIQYKEVQAGRVWHVYRSIDSQDLDAGLDGWYQECSECASSRQKRRRLADGVDDELFVSPAGQCGTCIFATNNLKFETNKLHAQMLAAYNNNVLTYVQAKDVATSTALRKRPGLVQKDYKTAWLHRHDRAC